MNAIPLESQGGRPSTEPVATAPDRPDTSDRMRIEHADREFIPRARTVLSVTRQKLMASATEGPHSKVYLAVIAVLLGCIGAIVSVQFTGLYAAVAGASAVSSETAARVTALENNRQSDAAILRDIQQRIQGIEVSLRRDRP